MGTLGRALPRRGTVSGLLLAAVCAALLAACSSPSAQLSATTGTTAPARSPSALAARLGPGPAGFVAEPQARAEGTTVGSFGAGRAVPANCGLVAARPEQLRGGLVRLFGGNPAHVGATALVCVVELATAAQASELVAASVRDRETSGAPTTMPFITFAVAGIPGAVGVGLPGHETVAFATGPYAVTVLADDPGADTPADPVTRAVARSVAEAVFGRLAA